MTIADEISKLQALRESGALSDEEFAQAKSRVFATEAKSTAGQSHTQNNGASPSMQFIKDMGRSRNDAVFGGVCGGLAQQVGVPSWVLRAAFAAAALLYGTGFLLYILLWVLMPFRENEGNNAHVYPPENTPSA